MKDSNLDQIRKRRLTGFTAALLLTLGVVVIFTSNAMPTNPSPGGGPWLNSADVGCGPGKVYAEWPDGVTNISMVCCVEEMGVVGTFNYNECDTYITHRLID